MRTMTWKGALILLSLAMTLMLVVAACGDDEDDAAEPAAAPETTTDTSGDAMGDAMMEKPTLVFSDLDWVSAQIQNAIARKILEDGYGYETDAVFGGTVPLMEALTRGDTNITMEIWLPNQQDAFDAAIAEGTIEVIGNSLEDNWQSAFIIPKYTADANPGLTSVEDLKNPEYMELFVTPDSKNKARLITCIPGWECEGINQAKVENYGLTDHVELINPGSDTALAAEIRSAFEQQEDVLFYYWGPTVLSNDLNTMFGGYVVLEEEPHTDECFASDYTCAYPVAEVLVVMRTDLVEQAPDVVEFFKKWDFNAGNQLAAEGYLNDAGADYPEVAEWFLANTEDWKNWVTPEALAKIEAAQG
ncbi:MAG: ABC transporter substrate-binding protein [Chloroflexota bacterium]|nr:ABC transporter substrate-binding protein [Chloroflexota bacterium]